MPGKNCSVFGCGSCRRTKGIGIWKLPAAKSDSYKKWRSDWLSVNTKAKVMNKSFKELLRIGFTHVKDILLLMILKYVST